MKLKDAFFYVLVNEKFSRENDKKVSYPPHEFAQLPIFILRYIRSEGSNISILSLKPEADVSHGSDSKSSATQVMELHSTRALAAAQISELTAPTRVGFMKKGSKQKTLVKILDDFL